MAIGDTITLSEKVNNEEIDLIYGLKDSRNTYISHLNLPVATIDRLNNKVIPNLINPHNGVELNSKENAYREFVSAPLAPVLLSHSDEDTIVKKVCKLGVAYVAKQGGRIRFILDDLEMGSIVQKNGRPGSSFTASELRYFFRHWEMPIGNEGKKVKDYVVFYSEFTEVAPPWESNPALWSRYQPKRRDSMPHVQERPMMMEPLGDNRACTPPISPFQSAKKQKMQ